jgi:glycosyltransferase involved in cell wall biosynthesis
MKKITIFTPAYNRSHLLDRLYKSLKEQTCNDFNWLIIDDGSSDDTYLKVQEFESEGLVELKYIKHTENRGMLEAHNTAYSSIESPYAMCIDSDDYLLPDSVELVLESFHQVEAENNIAGIIGLDISHSDSRVIGDQFPQGLEHSTFSELKFKYKIKGDKKFAYKMEVIKQFPAFPSYSNERFPAAGYLYRLIDTKYKLKILNKPLCIVDYQADGNTAMKVRQYLKSPNAFLDYRLLMLPISYNLQEKLRHSIHLGASIIITGRYGELFSKPFSLSKLIMFPLSIMLYIYINNKNKRLG